MGLAQACGNLDAFIGTALVDKFGKSGLLGKAQELFEQLHTRDVVSWTALISGYARHGHGKEAFDCYESMRCEGLSPNAATYVSVLSGFSALGAIGRGREVHARVIREGFLDTSVELGNVLIDMYAKAGDLDEAEEVFDTIPSRNVISWTVLIAGFARWELHEEALNCFRCMQCCGLVPDTVSWACILRVCGNLKAIDEGMGMHMDLIKTGLAKDVPIIKALLDMYAKCGADAEVQKESESLRARHQSISWNAIVSGCIENEDFDGALRCFEKMHSEGIPPDASAFMCILKACGNTNAISIGERIHGEIAMSGLLRNNALIGTALVDMYGKCGDLMKARQVFEQMPVWDVVSWTALISSYAQHGHGEAALDCFREMQCRGFLPDKVARICVLKACMGTRTTLCDAREMHVSIVEEAWLEKEEDMVVENALVDMYARCDALADARKLFNMRSNPAIEAWNAMIAGYVQHGLAEDALDCFERMRCCGSLPDSATFCRVLEACSAESSVTVNRGKERHVEIHLGGYLKTDLSIGNALLEMYARQRDPSEVQRAFDELSVRDETSWNRLMLSRLGPRKQLACFMRMKLESSLPSLTASACALNACGSLRASRDGERIHAHHYLLEEQENIVGNSLVDMYSKCRSFAKALQAFDALRWRNAISWTALISAYVEHARGNEALTCFRRMLQEGVLPDTVAYISILKACGEIRAINGGKETHATVIAEHIEHVDVSVGNALIRMYTECGLLPEAEEVFGELSNRDAISWGLLISGYAHHGYADATLAYVEEMEIEGSNVALDACTYVHILKACGSVGAIEKGIEIHEKLKTRGNLHDLVGNALVDMYAKCSEPRKAHDAFDDLPFRDIASWTALMAGYAQIGKLDVVEDLLERMIGEGIDPDAVLFTVLLNACSDGGLLDEGEELCLGAMISSYGIAPTREHCTCMVDLFSRAGQLDKALMVVEEMPRLDHLPAWATLLGACGKWGDEKLGELAFKHLVQLDSDNPLIYICMRNIYAIPSSTRGRCFMEEETCSE